MCPSCQVVRNWSVMERHFQPITQKNAKEMAQIRSSFLRTKSAKKPLILPATLKSVQKLGAEQLESMQMLFGIEMIPVATLATLKVKYDECGRTLYFPMRDVHGEIVGYKCVYKSANDDDNDDQICERSIPEANCFGVLCLDATVATKPSSTKEHPSAIVVLKVLDLLALSTVQKLNCKLN